MGATGGAGTVYPSGAPGFTPAFKWGCVARSLVICVWFVDRCLSFCPFSHYGVRPSLIYGFWLPFWYLQTLLLTIQEENTISVNQNSPHHKHTTHTNKLLGIFMLKPLLNIA